MKNVMFGHVESFYIYYYVDILHLQVKMKMK